MVLRCANLGFPKTGRNPKRSSCGHRLLEDPMFVIFLKKAFQQKFHEKKKTGLNGLDSF